MSQLGFPSEFTLIGEEEGSSNKRMNRGKVAHSTRKVFSLDALDCHPHDLLLSQMGKALKSDKNFVITACGMTDKKATLITLQYETEAEFLKVFEILDKYAQSKSAEMGSLNKGKKSETKPQPNEQAELKVSKTGDELFKSRALGSVNEPNFTSRRLNGNAPGNSRTSSMEDSSSITVLTLTNGESSSSYTDEEIIRLPKNFAGKGGKNLLNGYAISSRRDDHRQLASSSPTSENFVNSLQPVKIIRKPDKMSDQENLHKSSSLTSELSSETTPSQPSPKGLPARRTKYRKIPVQRLNTRSQSSSFSDSSSSSSTSSSSGYCDTCRSSSDSTVQFYKGVELIIPQCAHQHFNSTIDNVWVCNEPVDRRKSKITSHRQKSWLCFH